MCFRFIVMHVSELSKPFAATSSSSSSQPTTTTATTTGNLTPQQQLQPQSDNLAAGGGDSAATHTSTPATPSSSSSRLVGGKARKNINVQYFDLKNLCQIYEICMYYLNNEDNRIVIASLECLQLLIKLAPLKFSTYMIRSPPFVSRSHLKKCILKKQFIC